MTDTTTAAGAKRRHVTGAGARIGGDHISLHVIVQIGVIVVALSSFAISFTSLLDVARWQETPAFLHVLTPIMIDAPMVVFGTATIIFKHREQRAPMILTRVGSFVATAISSAANFLHTVSIRGLDDYEDVIGAGFNALAPWFVLFCTEILGHLITRPRSERGKVQRLQDEVKSLKATVRKFERDQKPRFLRGPRTPGQQAIESAQVVAIESHTPLAGLAALDQGRSEPR